MKDKDANIFISSLNKTSQRLEHYGDANIKNISLLKLLYKYGEYCTTQSQLVTLDRMVNQLQRSDSDICLEYNAVKGYLEEGVTVIGLDGLSNQAPTITATAITVTDEGYYITRNKLLEGYSDPENTDASLLVIKTVPANGTLYLNGTTVTANQTIDVSTTNVTLAYVRNSDSAYGTSFTYSAFDGDPNLPLESNIVACTLTVEEIVVPNEAPTVGDTTLFTDNRTTRVFTVADFTTSAIPQYTDPEGDGLDAIRIDSISNTNTGEYLYFGTAVVVNQVITAADIAAGAFTYVSPDVNSIKTDVIEVSVRDTGNMTWVS